VSTGKADGGQTAGQDAPEDLMTVREAAQAAGVTPGSVQSWIRRGLLTTYAQPPQGRQVSLAAVRALAAPLDPQTPPEAVLVGTVARTVGLPPGRIRNWAQRGLLPSWRGPHGLLICEVDVRAVALHSAAGGDTPPPSDALLIRDAARLSGLSRDRLYTWTKQGLLPVWRGAEGGQRVRLADVTALAERHGRGLPLHPRGAP